MKYFYILLLGIICISCRPKYKEQNNLIQPQLTEEQKAKQESIIDQYAVNKAHHYSYYIDMDKWQAALDEGLKEDSTIAYLWQQKAMPYFKIKKYEVGMDFIDKAVQYDPKRYLAYRGFIKCIFAKTYKEAIKDFETCIEKWGDSYEMDHTYTFYIGLSYLQLNEFAKAEEYLLKASAKQKEVFQDIHHLDLFYLGIVCYEQHRYEEAIIYFDKAIKEYKEFSDAFFYKALAQYKLGDESSKETSEEGLKYNKLGYTINEANAIYELYPYQVKRN